MMPLANTPATGFLCTLMLLALSSTAMGGETATADTARPAVIEASDYPSLQAALDAVPDSGGLVRLPPGTLEITQPLVVAKANTRVEGAGAATCVLNRNQQGQPALILRPAGLEENPKARLWRVQLANFRISGDPDAANNQGTKPKSGDGLLAQSVDEIYLEGMTIDHHGGHGVNLVNCYEDPRVVDCLFTYNAQAGLNIAAGHDIVVSANHFEENQDAVRCIDSFNLCMNGNNLDDHLGNGVVIENTYGSVLSGNMIEECNGTAVILDRDCYGITISANVIAHNVGGGVELRDGWGCAVSANTFTINGKWALAIRPGAGRVTVTGNSFCDCHIGGAVKRAELMAAGMLLEGTTDVTICGNLFSGLHTQAVRSDGKSQRILFTGNIVTEVNRGAKEPQPPITLGHSGQTRVENNLLEDEAEPGSQP